MSNRLAMLRVLLFVGIVVATPCFPQKVLISIAGERDNIAYVCWAPVQATLQLADEAPGDIDVKLDSAPLDGHGDIGLDFQEGARPARQSFYPWPSLILTLPRNGDKVPFSVAVRWSRSTDVGQVYLNLTVSRENQVIASKKVLLRVRKDADNLSADERRDFLDSVSKLYAQGWFTRYVVLHKNAEEIAHKSDAFLVWHRAFILDFERRLQEINPRIALPYWKYDQKATEVFKPGFMGETSNSTIVQFSDGSAAEKNPLFGYRVTIPFKYPGVASEGPLQRNPIHELTRNGVLGVGPRDDSEDQYELVRHKIQEAYHDTVHSTLSYYLAAQATAAADPIFFLLHANVDRAWAKWQRRVSQAENPSTAIAYSQSKKGRFVLGTAGPRSSFEDEPLWPWNYVTGPNDGGDDPDGPDAFRIGFPPREGFAPRAPEPLVRDMIDYMGVENPAADLGYCYDDTGFFQ